MIASAGPLHCSPVTLALVTASAGRLDAEREWLSLRKRGEGLLYSHVFRLAGIYGPRRSALDTVAREREDSAQNVLQEDGQDQIAKLVKAAREAHEALR